MSEEKDLISVIVPVYNVQAFLPQCVESIINQTYKNLEIILVDDGTPDESGKICDEYQKKDARIKVIHKQNGGLSDARNAGIEIAQGNYICFIDSDDLIHKDYIKCQYEQIVATNSDVSICLFDNFFEETEIKDFEVVNPEIQELDKHNLTLKLFEKNNIHYICAWSKIYKRSLFETLRFDVGRLHEDEFIVYKIFDLCKKAVVVNVPLYLYRQRQGSITKASAYKQKNLDSFYSILSCYEFFVGTEYENLALNRLINSTAFIYCVAKARKADKQILKFLLGEYKKYYKLNKTKTLKQRLFYFFPNVLAKFKKVN